MSAPIIDTFFALLRYALGAEALPITEPLTLEQWKAIFSLSKKQSLLGVIYSGVKRLPAELQPPADLMQQWTLVARRIMATNNLMNATAARLTQMFAEKGRKTVILKGQANALLYPDPYLRQTGDIDILVEGGRKNVLNLLKEMGLMDGADVSEIHVHLDKKKFEGASVEVHFDPARNYSPVSTKNMRSFLESEFRTGFSANLQHEGFFSPSVPFAMIMQLSHIQRHFIGGGVGLRQLADYYELLKNCTEKERSDVRKALKACGLSHIASAVMWIMKDSFCIAENRLICCSHERRGRMLLHSVLDGGNFGYHSSSYKKRLLIRWFIARFRDVQLLSFDWKETLWYEIFYFKDLLLSFPSRIRRGDLSGRF